MTESEQSYDPTQSLHRGPAPPPPPSAKNAIIIITGKHPSIAIEIPLDHPDHPTALISAPRSDGTYAWRNVFPKDPRYGFVLEVATDAAHAKVHVRR